jgi:hypothetical protein
MEGHTEVADIFRAYGSAYRKAYCKKMPLRNFRVMNAIEICRTKELGGHVDECDACGSLRISYNSCRNRHCPKCQCLDKERWLEARKRDILPTHYFHIVFTIPEALRPIALRNQKVVYGILFKAASATLKELAEDPKHLGVMIGFIALLHTWSQTLIDHPHIHCIVTGGGLSLDGKRWIKGKKQFFLPVKIISRLFRGKLLAYLKKAYLAEELQFSGKISELKEHSVFNALLTNLYNQEWVVYCKAPFKKPETVIDYLGRYTHRVAITNDRISQLAEEKVTFRYRDRDENNKIKFMSLDAFEFIRRFLFHVLPDGFMKIRHYGILSNRNRKEKLFVCKQLLGAGGKASECDVEKESWEDLLFRITGIDPTVCPTCGKGKMVQREKLQPKRGRCPP